MPHFGETSVVFSPSKFWTGQSKNTNSLSAPEGSALSKARNYATKLGGEGRLLHYNEAEAYKNKSYNWLYGRSDGNVSGGLNYWLSNSTNGGTSDEYVDYIYGVPGSGSQYWIFPLKYNNAGKNGVRPVVTIHKGFCERAT